MELRSLRGGLALVALALPLGACSDGAAGGTCVSEPREVEAEGRREIVLLVDGETQALLAAAEDIAADPSGAFSEPSLGFGEPAEAEGGDDAAVSGVVSLVTYNERGEAVVNARYDLEGTGKNQTNKERDADAQAQCLVEGVETLADAKAAGRPLLRGLDGLQGKVRGDTVVVIATGLSRSTVEGQQLVDSVGTPEGRAEALSTIQNAGLLPNLDGIDGVWFLAPGEGTESQVTEVALEAFADDLCARLQLEHCGPVPAVP